MYTKLQTVCKIFCLCEGYTAALTSLPPLFSLFLFSFDLRFSSPSIILTAAWCQAARIYSVICVCLCSRECGCACMCMFCVFLRACQLSMQAAVCMRMCVSTHSRVGGGGTFLKHTCFLTFHLSPSSLPSALLPAHMKSEVIPKEPLFSSFLGQKVFPVKNIPMCWWECTQTYINNVLVISGKGFLYVCGEGVVVV